MSNAISIPYLAGNKKAKKVAVALAKYAKVNGWYSPKEFARMNIEKSPATKIGKRIYEFHNRILEWKKQQAEKNLFYQLGLLTDQPKDVVCLASEYNKKNLGIYGPYFTNKEAENSYQAAKNWHRPTIEKAISVRAWVEQVTLKLFSEQTLKIAEKIHKVAIAVKIGLGAAALGLVSYGVSHLLNPIAGYYVGMISAGLVFGGLVFEAIQMFDLGYRNTIKRFKGDHLNRVLSPYIDKAKQHID